MNVVGYFEGTDSPFLTKWILNGVDTLPLSNGVDGHGTYVAQITNSEVQVVVGYLHKLVPPKWMAMKPRDLLYPLKLQKIPVIVMVDEEDWGKARNLLSDIEADITFCDPKNVVEKVLEMV